jgi:RNA:NAD 2'-phosphotransferase (TPT1/KptA family)
VPASLGVFQAAAGKYVHVIERHPGKLLSSLEPEVASLYLRECATLLALFHKSIGVSGPTGSGWQPLRKSLKLWCGSLFPAPGEADRIIEGLKSALPSGLPLVRKRDSHPGNWVIDAANRVVAIDLDSPVMLPVGHDLVQLVEDGALLPVSDEGFSRRYSLFRSYLTDVGIELDAADVEIVYDWFALYRATWTATSSLARKAQHSHARQLARYIASTQGGRHALGDVAESVSSAMRSMSPSSKVSELTASQRRISKSMSKVLRHSAVDAGLQPDDGGFVSLVDVAREIRQSVDVLLEVATHPAEPRFQVVDDRIRALYGHSFPVVDLYEVNVEMPETLFHGSSWDHLSQIAAAGLLPRARQHVHLTNNPAEAIEVARRHGHAVLLAVATSSIGSLRAVADAVWAATEVDAAGVRVLNAFEELPTPPDWLAEAGPVEVR